MRNQEYSAELQDKAAGGSDRAAPVFSGAGASQVA